MQDLNRFGWLLCGMILGGAGMLLYLGDSKPALAANNDRFEDFVMCTGAVATAPKGTAPGTNVPTDGVWVLDYRTGKLLGTVIDRGLGKIMGWAEVDLVTEYGVKPKDPVHFMMTTGNIANGQAALYVAETTSGKLGVYTMASRTDGKGGVVIRRHDLVLFRQPGGAN
jgi:hypothetical protein